MWHCGFCGSSVGVGGDVGDVVGDENEKWKCGKEMGMGMGDAGGTYIWARKSYNLYEPEIMAVSQDHGLVTDSR